ARTSAQKRKMYLITGTDGGQTLYVGAPSSDQRGRLYNKEVQSEQPEYARTWRYETVLRNERATNALHRVQAEKSNRSSYISAIVALWWESRGIEAPWSYNAEVDPLPPQKTLPSDVEKQLEWIRVQVAPTIRRLTAQGY